MAVQNFTTKAQLDLKRSVFSQYINSVGTVAKQKKKEAESKAALGREAVEKVTQKVFETTRTLPSQKAVYPNTQLSSLDSDKPLQPAKTLTEQESLYWEDPKRYQALYGESPSKVVGKGVGFLPTEPTATKFATEVRKKLPAPIPETSDAIRSSLSSFILQAAKTPLTGTLAVLEQSYGKGEGGTPSLLVSKGTPTKNAVTERLTEAIGFLNEAQQNEYSSLNKKWQQNVFKLTNGVASMLSAVGIYAATKSPSAAAATLSAIESGDVYNEARAAGQTPSSALGIAGASFAGTYLLEKIGLDYLFKAGTGSYLTNFIKKFAVEGLQETAQTGWQDLVSNHGYDKSYSTLSDYWDSFWVGGLVGGGTSVVINFADARSPEAKAVKELEKLGSTKEEAQAIVSDFRDYAVSQGDQMINEFNDQFTFKENRLAGYAEGITPEGRPGIEKPAALPDKTLLGVHNLSESNLIFADKLGGLANPSLAIFEPSKTSFPNFGEISLVGGPEMTVPGLMKGGKTYGADVYSPRFPSQEYILDFKQQDSLTSKLKKYESLVEEETSKLDLTYDVERNLENSSLMMASFLDSKGIKPKVVNGENYQTKNNLREQIQKIGNQDFVDYIEREVESVGGERKFFAGFTPGGQKRYKPFTAENASKLMKAESRGGENFFYGLGSVRAKLTPEFKSLDQIRKARNKIVDRGELDEIIKKNDEKFAKILDKLGEYAKFKDDNQFTEYDRQSQILADYMSGEDVSFFKEKFGEIPSSLKKKIDSFREDLKDMPTEYFETKYKRPVGLEEFKAAVVPDNVSDKTRAVLKGKGLEIIEYKANDEIARRKALLDLTTQKLPTEILPTEGLAYLRGPEGKLGDVYTRNYEMNAPKRVSVPEVTKFTGAIGKIADKYIGTISTRLGNINQSLKVKLRRMEYDVRQSTKKDIEKSVPFLDKVKTMEKKDRIDFDLARKNGDVKKINEFVDKYNMRQEYNNVRDMLDTVYKRMDEVGYKMGYKRDYFPRVVKDTEGFLEYFRDSPDWPVIQQAIQAKERDLKRNLDDQEKAELINSLLRGFKSGIITLSDIGAAKSRTIEMVTPELNKFYMDSDAALLGYINAANESIESRKFFGKGESVSVEDSIGMFVLDLIQKGEITISQEVELTKILKARFKPKGPGKYMNVFKNLSYMGAMGSPSSAITQIGDLAFVLYKAGVIKSTKGIYKTVAGQSKYNKADLGIEQMAQEFADQTKTGKAVTQLFRVIGLEAMDTFGKNNLINSVLDKYKSDVIKGDETALKKLEKIFGEESGEVISDLKNDVDSENVKFLAFYELSEVQPITLSEVPEGYLTGGNGRVFYMLKTYTVKLFDVYRNEVFQEIASGDPKRMAQGTKNLVKLTTALAVMNASADWLKDFLFGRNVDLEDIVIDNLFKLFGVNRFITWQARTEGLYSAISKQILPPFNFLDNLGKDMYKFFTDRDVLFEEGFESTQTLPVLGKLYYWWLGKGRAKSEKKRIGGSYEAYTILKEAEERQVSQQEANDLKDSIKQAVKDGDLTMDEARKKAGDFKNKVTKYKESMKIIKRLKEKGIRGSAMKAGLEKMNEQGVITKPQVKFILSNL
jgi:hypothetical protein